MPPKNKKNSPLNKKKNTSDTLLFRERRWREIPHKLEHPEPDKSYQSTLPGAPGWEAKEHDMKMKGLSH